MKRRKGGRTAIPLTSFRQRSRGECPNSTILRILNNRDYFLRIFSTSFDHLYSSKPFYKHLSPNRKLTYLENLILSSGYVNLLCFSRQQFPTSRSLILLQRIEKRGGKNCIYGGANFKGEKKNPANRRGKREERHG